MSISLTCSEFRQATTQHPDLLSQATVVEKLSFHAPSYAVPKAYHLYHQEDDRYHLPWFLMKSLGYPLRPEIKKRHQVLPWYPLYVSLRDYQQQWYEVFEKTLTQSHSLTLAAYPGFGKTLVSMYLGLQLGFYLVVVFKQSSLILSWKKTMEDHFPSIPFWIVAAKTSKKPPAQQPPVIITTIGMVDKIPKAWRHNIATLLLDEIHTLTITNAIRPIMSFEPQYMILMSATPEGKKDGREDIFTKIGGTSLITVPSPHPYRVIFLLTGVVIETQGEGLPGVTATYLASLTAPARHQVLVDLFVANPERKFLVLSRYTTGCLETVKLCQAQGLDVGTYIANSKTPTNHRVVFATSGKAGTGFDEANSYVNFEQYNQVSNTVVFNTTVMDPSNFTQFRSRVCGRATDPIVIVPIDNNNLFIRQYKRLWRFLQKDPLARLDIIQAPQLKI